MIGLWSILQLREEGAHEVFLTVLEFNESFRSKFPSIKQLSASRLKEILRGFARFNLIETDWTDDFADSSIQILPTLRFAIPFPDIEEWLRVASQFQEEGDTEQEQEDTDTGDADESVTGLDE